MGNTLSNPDVLNTLKEGEPQGTFMILDNNLRRILLELVLDVKNYPENLQYVDTENQKFWKIPMTAPSFGQTVTPENDPRKDSIQNGQTIQSIFDELSSIEFFEVLTFILLPNEVNNDLQQAIFSTIQEMRKTPMKHTPS